MLLFHEVLEDCFLKKWMLATAFLQYIAPWFCFPFRLFCDGIDDCSGALKLQKEREKAKKERRKEKRREKKEKREKSGHENSQHTVHIHKKRRYEEWNQLDQKDVSKAKATADADEQLKSALTEEHEQPCSIRNAYDNIHKKRKYEEWSQLDQKDGSKAKATADAVEQLEKSALTEEHGQPFSILNAYDSSESSQDSSMRRKLVARKLVAANTSQDNRGSILRIRLPLVKQKDPTPTSMPVVKQRDPAPPAQLPIVKQEKKSPPARLSIVKTEQTPSASVPIVKQKGLEPPAAMPTVKQKDLKPPATMPTEKQNDLKPGATMSTLNQTDLELSRSSEEPCFSGRIAEPDLKLEAAKTPYSKSISKRNRRMSEMERQFTDLLVNWSSVPLELEHSDIGNQDWLFGSSKRQPSPVAKRCQASAEGLLRHGSSVPSLQPQACYMSDFDMYQLPYAIPY